MNTKLIQLIDREDKRNPHTDQAIAKLLGCQRENVTLLRKELGIGDSRERRKPILEATIKEILSEGEHYSEREITRQVKEHGFNISRYVIREVLKDCQNSKEMNEPSTSEKQSEQKELKAFDKIIGHNGSLGKVVQQAKAAMLYPPRGLHTLITGPTGVGKSELANAMHLFAKQKGRIRDDNNFVVFNCADYSNNPQLLMAQLFGYVKGAFTGADSDRKGLVERADGGLLFLDEVHRLPPKGQEMLFHLIDQGIFRRLGEADGERHVQLTLIAATTENLDSSLLGTFRRRIPMVIEIPPIDKRPLVERLSIIKRFLQYESARTGMVIRVRRDAASALMLYNCPGNVGQIKSDIQVACARSFLNAISMGQSYMLVTLEDLPDYSRDGIQKTQRHRHQLQGLVKDELLVLPDMEQNDEEIIDPLAGGYEIYKYIEVRHQQLKERNLDTDVISYIISNEIEESIKAQINSHKKNIGANDLRQLVDEDVLDAVNGMIRIGQKRLGVDLSKIHHALAMHVTYSLERITEGKKIQNPNMDRIRQHYHDEFDVAQEMLDLMESKFDVMFPEEEAAFIAMYLRQITEVCDYGGNAKVGVLLITHGEVAPAIADVANGLLDVNHARGLAMPLTQSFEKTVDEAVQMVQMIDEGKGVLLMVDMGSLTTLDRLIYNRTGIQTRIISRVGTVTVIEAVRKAMLPDSDLDEIADYLINVNESQQWETAESKQPVIITTCITGKGSARRIKQMLEDNMDYRGETKIKACGTVGRSLSKEIEDLEKRYNVIAIAGTIDPRRKDIPFVSLESILDGSGIRMLEVLTEERGNYCGNVGLPDPDKILTERMVVKGLALESATEGIDFVNARLVEDGYVTDEFLESMYRREEMIPTILETGVALPHGESSHVVHPGICILVPEKTIDWNGQKVELIFGLALTPDCIHIVEAIHRLTSKKESVLEMRTMSEEQILTVVKEEIKRYVR